MILPSACLLLGLFVLCEAQIDFGKCGQNLDIGETRLAPVIETASDPLGTWPWMVSLGQFEGFQWKHICGSVVISQKYVITAAHCMIRDRLQLRLGDKNLKSPADDFGANIREIARIIFHPKYSPESGNSYYDIAILRVRPSITYSGYIRPICMPPVSHDLDQYAGHQVTVTGWGFATRNAVDGGVDLRSVPIKIFPQRTCNRTHSVGISAPQEFEINRLLPQLFTPNTLCAGYERPLFGPCKGDSGSPLVIYQFEPPRYVLLGLVQGGIGTCGDKDFPAIFTRIDAKEISDFIKEETGLTSSGGSGTSASGSPTTIDETSDENGNSRVMLFSQSPKQYNRLKTILDEGDNVNIVNKFGQNALMLASGTNGTLRSVNLLIHHGINIHAQDNEGKNALHYAAQEGNLPVIQSLLTKGLAIDSEDHNDETPLSRAVEYGNYGTVKHLLEQGADIHRRTSNEKYQPIHFTTLRPEGSSVIRLLLDHGADIEARSTYEVTPLYLSVVKGQLDATQELYAHGAKVDVFNNGGESVLYKAAQLSHIEHMRWIESLEGGAVLKRLLNYGDDKGETPLLVATFSNQPAAVRELLSYGDKRSALNDDGVDINHGNNIGLNALMEAGTKNGTLVIVNMLLNHGININHEDKYGRNALHIAAKYGNLPVLQRLLQKGLAIDSLDEDGESPLFPAVRYGKYGTVKYLLKQGANVSIRTTVVQSQPIHFATFEPDGSSVIQLLLDYGADLESRNKFDSSPIYLSFVGGYLNTTEQLHELGAEVDVYNNAGESVLHKIAVSGSSEQFHWLHELDGGVTMRRLLNKVDQKGETALITAAFSNKAEIVKLLLFYGADRTIRDKSDRNALDHAKSQNYSDIVILLEQR